MTQALATFAPDRTAERGSHAEPTVDHSRPQLSLAAATARVAAIDLTPVMRLLGDEKPDVWSSPRLAEGERDYRRFLALQLLYPGTRLVPSRQIDAVWHCHILDTRKYHADCMALSGRYLHHNPHFGTGGEEEQQRMQSAFRRTQELWVATFGDPPPVGLPRECCYAPPPGSTRAECCGGGDEG